MSSAMFFLGLGNIGSEVAGIGLAFDMKVIAWSTELTPVVHAFPGPRIFRSFVVRSSAMRHYWTKLWAKNRRPFFDGPTQSCWA
jgi:hypothetical protein